ncbi:FHA domain-containing protein [Microbacterium sp. H1-D42]|uniref:FHA domain-containing protein n=1 Tax=Microbacterium sp. H1-D42 TaxID=2925844 RepID=UPI001F530B58|nr:FHA domain-containing protein [Microbacterium sp. H1-D42]UNK70422.1 FHA domain-containing protein [Microbacterium sp. H1-D42]
MNQFSYRPGAWQVVVEDGGIVAVPGDVAPERIVRLTRMLQAGTPALTEVIDVLAAGSIATLGSFAVALTPGGAVRFAVRGPVTVRISGAAGADTVSGADVSTWSERFVVDPQGFELVLDEQSDAVAYPIRSGVVLAGSVRSGEPDASADVEAEGAAAVDADEPALVEEPVLVEKSVLAEEPALVDDPAPAEEPADADETPVEDPDSRPELHTLMPTEFTFAPEVAPEPATAPVPEATPALDADALEQTVHKAPSPLLPPPAPPLPPFTPPMPPAPAPPASLGDHDGATISLAEVRRLRAEAGAAAGDPNAPTEMIPTTESPASSHGVVRISTGQVIELDRTVIIGRRPRSTRASGETMPHLVAVDSPQQDISRSHLEIRPEGDSVVVIDLRTTNGSTLIRPGVDPMRLHPGEHTLVLDGDVVDLGDGVTVIFEGLA